jgi:hypothetical protein
MMAMMATSVALAMGVLHHDTTETGTWNGAIVRRTDPYELLCYDS